MPRKRKYDTFFEYKDDGTAHCRIGRCARRVISRAMSNGMPKHMRVHHPYHYELLVTKSASEVPLQADVNSDVISAGENSAHSVFENDNSKLDTETARQADGQAVEEMRADGAILESADFEHDGGQLSDDEGASFRSEGEVRMRSAFKYRALCLGRGC